MKFNGIQKYCTMSTHYSIHINLMESRSAAQCQLIIRFVKSNRIQDTMSSSMGSQVLGSIKSTILSKSLIFKWYPYCTRIFIFYLKFLYSLIHNISRIVPTNIRIFGLSRDLSSFANIIALCASSSTGICNLCQWIYHKW